MATVEELEAKVTDLEEFLRERYQSVHTGPTIDILLARAAENGPIDQRIDRIKEDVLALISNSGGNTGGTDTGNTGSGNADLSTLGISIVENVPDWLWAVVDSGSRVLLGIRADGTVVFKGSAVSAPVRGVDYWTDTDKQEIIDSIIVAIGGEEELRYKEALEQVASVVSNKSGVTISTADPGTVPSAVSNALSGLVPATGDTDTTVKFSGQVLLVSNIREVIVGQGMLSIGTNAFANNPTLNSIRIADTVTLIDSGAFNKCTNLDNVVVPGNVRTIGANAFNGCTGMTKLDLLDGIDSLGANSFQGCTSLTELELPDSILTIGSYTFADCSVLRSINIPKEISTIEERTFAGCSKLERVIFPDTLLSIKLNAYRGCASLKEITIPGNVSEIGLGAFFQCSGLERVIIEEGVESIGDYAFGQCTELLYVQIPGSIKDLTTSPSSAVNSRFAGSTKLQTVGPIGGEYNIEYGFTEKIPDRLLTRVAVITEVTIANGIETIGNTAFYQCTGLTKVTIADSVKNIQQYAFDGCNKLTDVYYEGTQEQWNQINIAANNTRLTGATIHFNS